MQLGSLARKTLSHLQSSVTGLLTLSQVRIDGPAYTLGDLCGRAKSSLTDNKLDRPWFSTHESKSIWIRSPINNDPVLKRNMLRWPGEKSVRLT